MFGEVELCLEVLGVVEEDVGFLVEVLVELFFGVEVFEEVFVFLVDGFIVVMGVEMGVIILCKEVGYEVVVVCWVDGWLFVEVVELLSDIFVIDVFEGMLSILCF